MGTHTTCFNHAGLSVNWTLHCARYANFNRLAIRRGCSLRSLRLASSRSAGKSNSNPNGSSGGNSDDNATERKTKSHISSDDAALSSGSAHAASRRPWMRWRHPLTPVELRKATFDRSVGALLDADVPIASVLCHRDAGAGSDRLKSFARKHDYSKDCHSPAAEQPSKNPVDNDPWRTLSFPLLESSRRALMTGIRPLLSKQTFSAVDAIPSVSSGLAVLSAPYRGAEKFVRHVADCAAAEIGAELLTMRLLDVFQRVPPYAAIASFAPSKVSPQSEFSTRFRDRESQVTPFMIESQLKKLAEGGPKVLRAGNGSPSPTVLDVDDVEIPFPWFLPYATPMRQPLAIPPPLAPFDADQETERWLILKLTEAIMTVAASGDPRTPKMILFEDLMHLFLGSSMAQRHRQVSCVLEAINHVRYSERQRYPPILVLAPYTKSSAPVVHFSSEPQGLLQIIQGIKSGRQDEDSDDDDPRFAATSFNSSAAATSTGIQDGDGFQHSGDFYSPISHILGVPTFQLVPTTDLSEYHEFIKTLDADHDKLLIERNLVELGIAADFANLALPYEWDGIWIEGKGDAESGVIRRLQPDCLSVLKKPMLPSDIESLVLMLLDRAVYPEALAKPSHIESSLVPKRRTHSHSVANVNSQQNGVAQPVVDFDGLNDCIRIMDESQKSLSDLDNVLAVQGLFPNSKPTTKRLSSSLMDLVQQRKSLNQHEQRILRQCLVLPSKSAKFNLIGGLKRAKQVIHDVIQLPLQRPELFQRGILQQSTSGMLLFGPPGTGKTMLARATAAEAGANFLAVAMSNLQSMWVGENEKNVRALFSLARKLRPCIVFIDEIDALLQTRGRGGMTPQWALNTLNEFMLEWDGIQGDANRGILVMGSTNRPFDLDDAVLRRMPRRILVDLPDQEAREEILWILLRDDKLSDGLNFPDLARRTEMYSGSDLKNLCIAAALERLRQGEDPLSWHHFEVALKHVLPGVERNSLMMRQLRDWDAVYGTRGSMMVGKGIGFLQE